MEKQNEWHWHLGGAFHDKHVVLYALSLFHGDKDENPAVINLWYAQDVKDSTIFVPQEAVEYEKWLNENALPPAGVLRGA